jgi:hypothetical protein
VRLNCKILINIFLITAALNTVTLNQFAKLPLLAVHYIDHWHKDHKVTVWDFFSMHYFGNDVEDNDSDQDRQLPMKSITLTAFQIFTAPSVSRLDNARPIAYGKKPKVVLQEQFFPTQAIASIFRPPKA